MKHKTKRVFPYVIWFQFLREGIVAYIRYWIEIITVPLRFSDMFFWLPLNICSRQNMQISLLITI